MGSYYLREWHMRWFEDHMGEGVALRDISDRVTGFALAGPESREILQKLTHQMWAPCRSWAARLWMWGSCAVAWPACRSPASWALKSTVRRWNMPACGGCCCRPGPIWDWWNSASPRAMRCVWRKASATGTASSPKVTRRAKPGWTASSTGKSRASSVKMQPAPNAPSLPPRCWSRGRFPPAMPIAAGMSRSGPKGSWWVMSPRAAMGRPLARACACHV